MDVETTRDVMPTGFSISRTTGAILIGADCSFGAGDAKEEVERLVARWKRAGRDHGNGYEWLDLTNLTLAGEPAGLSLCFHHGGLEQATWSVTLPDAPFEGGWPSRQAIDAEVRFVRGELSRSLDFPRDGSAKSFDWGEIWSMFDPKAFIAAHGLRYSKA